jgi:flagella basal body P-ring formation protein FlgA
MVMAQDYKVRHRKEKTVFTGTLCLMLAWIIGGIYPFSWNSVSAETASGDTFSMEISHAVTVKEDQIYIKDIMNGCSDTNLIQRIGNLSIGKAPPPGREKIIRGSWIESFFRSNNWLQNRITLSVPDTVRVVRAHQTLPERRLKRLFRDYIAERINGAEFKVSRFRIRRSHKLPLGRITFDVGESSKKRILGSVVLPMTVYVDGKETERIILSAWIDQYQNVVCADRYLPRNSTLKAADLRFERINISKAPRNLITHLNHSVGKRLKQSVKAGQYLRANMLAAPLVIQRGDRVKILVENGPLKIETIGVAKNSGGIGAQIRVENISSKKTVVGRIRDATTVEILF